MKKPDTVRNVNGDNEGVEEYVPDDLAMMMGLMLDHLDNEGDLCTLAPDLERDWFSRLLETLANRFYSVSAQPMRDRYFRTTRNTNTLLAG